MDQRILPIYVDHTLSEAEWRDIKTAALSLSKPYSIKPSRGVYGSPGYILAIGSMPDFVSDGVALVPNTSVAGLPIAIDAVLEHKNDSRLINMAGQLSKMLGAEVTEIEPERVGQAVAFK